MKKFLTFCAIGTIMFSMLQAPVHAIAGKWSSSGSIIYYKDGGVGIGTSSPRSSLDVTGDVIFGRSGGSKITIQTPSTDVRLHTFGSPLVVPSGNVGIGTLTPRSNFDVTGDAIFGRAGGSKVVIQTPASDVRFYTYGRPLLIPTGNVGIGTLLPTKTLSVNGTVLAKEVIVSTIGAYWPDYVFEEGYDLMPLNEIEKFIEENGHLPGVSPAADVEKDGLSIGEMQIVQMEKIEELTLHLIEKEKEINDLEQINKDFEIRIKNLETLLLSENNTF